MKIIYFRPYKKLEDMQLMLKIFETYENLKKNTKSYEENIDLCNALIKEAKARKLSCPKELMYKNIIYTK